MIRGYHRKAVISENDFKTVMALTEAGYKNIKVAELIGTSPASVSRIKKYRTWDAYQDFKKQVAERVRMSKRSSQESEDRPPLNTQSETVVLLKDIKATMDKLVALWS